MTVVSWHIVGLGAGGGAAHANEVATRPPRSMLEILLSRYSGSGGLSMITRTPLPGELREMNVALPANPLYGPSTAST